MVASNLSDSKKNYILSLPQLDSKTQSQKKFPVICFLSSISSPDGILQWPYKEKVHLENILGRIGKNNFDGHDFQERE